MNKNEIKADLKSLAYSWDELAKLSDNKTNRYLARSLATLVRAYLRGQGINLDSVSSYNEHGIQEVRLMFQVVDLVNECSDIWFPTLSKLSISHLTLINFRDDILSQVKDLIDGNIK